MPHQVYTAQLQPLREQSFASSFQRERASRDGKKPVQGRARAICARCRTPKSSCRYGAPYWLTPRRQLNSFEICDHLPPKQARRNARGKHIGRRQEEQRLGRKIAQCRGHTRTPRCTCAGRGGRSSRTMKVCLLRLKLAYPSRRRGAIRRKSSPGPRLLAEHLPGAGAKWICPRATGASCAFAGHSVVTVKSSRRHPSWGNHHPRKFISPRRPTGYQRFLPGPLRQPR